MGDSIVAVMKWLIEKSRYLALVAVVGLQIGAIAALYDGARKVVRLVQIALVDVPSDSKALPVLFESLDSFLVAIALIVISVSIYELFIGDLAVPDWMTVKNLSELKAKFGVVLIPVMAVKFVQKLLQSESSLDTLYYGIAVAVVSAALTVLTIVAEKEKQDEIERHPEEEETRAKDL
ncbi:MAG TPA: YqhA family protein [Pyrinomonadaceae bacterium]|nr:YqhA family protein [Pyrinomonadaceae bacterium]